MDTSETYINMCRQAKELQGMWEPKDGDFFAIEHRGEVSVRSVHSCESEDIIPRGEWLIDTVSDSMDCDECTTIWLPRIDQSIELLSKEFPYWTQFDGFELFRRIADVYDRDKRSGTSEQRILELLMGEKYNKYWNGVDWA